MNIPKIEYEVYYPLNNSKMEKLNLSICEDIKIEIFIPINMTDDIEKYNPKSDYYNDICSKTTTESGTDMILNDRRDQFIDKNMSLCEDNCEFITYNNENKKVKCECEIKPLLSFVDEIKIDKNNLMKNFKNIHNIANIQIMKCYKIVFNKKDLFKNFGFYIIASNLVLLVICLILFFAKYYNILIKELNEIVTAKKGNENFPNEINKKKKAKKKLKTSNQDNYITKSIKLNKNKKGKKIKASFPPKKKKLRTNKMKLINQNSSNRKKIITETISNNIQNKFKKILEYNDYELNSLSYNDAINYDKRTFFKYYISLIKTNHLVIFSFFPNKDYNSQIIKIFLFFFFFALNLIVNALFFNDDTMHKIYIDSGSFNLNYQIPQIIFSSLISGVISAIVKYLSLSEKHIISIKQLSSIKNIDKKVKELIANLKRKFILFFVITFLILLIFCFYISCFCGIYINTQIHLIKDTIIGFCLSFIYPFFICLLPGIFRIKALNAGKKDKECMFKFSKLLQ